MFNVTRTEPAFTCKVVADDTYVEKKPEEYDPNEACGCTEHLTAMECVENQCDTVFFIGDPVLGEVEVSFTSQPTEWTRPMYWGEFFRCIEIAEQISEDLMRKAWEAEYE